jgi:hypothetical protein
MTFLRGRGEEQQRRYRARAHGDGGDHEAHCERDLRIDEKHRAHGDQPACDGDEREKAPDR